MSQANTPQNNDKFSIHGTRPKNKTELLQHVRHLFDQGFNLVPLQAGEKKALNSWKTYQDRRQTWQELSRMNWQGGLAGINGISGLRSFDFDHLDLFGPVGELLEVLGLPITYEWVVRSGNGYHVWVRCEEEVILGNTPRTRYVGYPKDPEKYPFKQVELRLFRSYTAVPPSDHPSGKSYEWKYKHALPTGEIAVVTAQQLAAAFFALATLQPERATTRTTTPVSYSIPSTLQAKPHTFTREEQVLAQVDTVSESFAARW